MPEDCGELRAGSAGTTDRECEGTTVGLLKWIRSARGDPNPLGRIPRDEVTHAVGVGSARQPCPARRVYASGATGKSEGSKRMFASMRRYRLQPGSVAEFMRRVDESFADEIAAQAGFVSYQLIDCGGGDLFTLSIFLEPDQAEASRELAQRWTEEYLQDIAHTRFEAIHGESLVSRAASGMLEPGPCRRRTQVRGHPVLPAAQRLCRTAHAEGRSHLRRSHAGDGRLRGRSPARLR